MKVTVFTGSKRWRAALAVAAGAFVVGLAPLADGDLWWHLAAGREIVRTHALPTVDTLSSGAAGRPWIDVHWGFQLAAYGLHVLGGLRLLVLVKCALVAAGALLLLGAVARGAGPRARPIFAAVFVLTLFAGRGLLLLRPVIPTLVFVAAFFYALERFRAEGRTRWLVLLPPLQLAWANVQGLSMLGPALVGAYALAMGASAVWGARAGFPFAREDSAASAPSRLARLLFVTLGCCFVACAATPYGLAGLALPFRLLHRLAPGADSVYALNVAEEVPPWVVARTSPDQVAPLAGFLLLVAASFASARRLRLSHVCVLGGLVALALAANRNVLLLYWLGTPIAVMAATPALRRLRVAAGRSRAAGWAARLVWPAGFALAVLAAAREPRLAEAAPFRVPTTSADVIAAGGGSGTIFAADQFGGYLAWRLGPAWKPWMDTRLVLRTPEEFAEYLALADEPTRFDSWEEAHRMDYVLLPVGYPDRYLGLAAHLYASDRWRLVHTNGSEVLFARAEVVGPQEVVDLGAGTTVDEILAGIEQRFGAAPALRDAARLQLATLALVAGEGAQAERVLAGTRGSGAAALLARCRFAAGDLETARRASETLLARDRDDVRSLDLLAAVAAKRGDKTEALALLRRALDVDPFDAEALRILETWEGHVETTR